MLTVNADVDLRTELQKIQVPALIIRGGQDASAPIELTGRKAAELTGGASCTLPRLPEPELRVTATPNTSAPPGRRGRRHADAGYVLYLYPAAPHGGSRFTGSRRSGFSNKAAGSGAC
jgi:pimeloyl-ACP methyl ester carboxylesterase